MGFSVVFRKYVFRLLLAASIFTVFIIGDVRAIEEECNFVSGEAIIKFEKNVQLCGPPSAFSATTSAKTTSDSINAVMTKFGISGIKEITFDNMANILANFDTDGGSYCFSKPFVTYYSRAKDYADYYFVKFYPTAGIYKITAKIYSCYRDDVGFHLSDPEEVTRTITVGLVGLDFNSSFYSYAWLPDDIADHGIMLASVPTSTTTSGIQASAAVAPAIPEVFYAFANNNAKGGPK